MRAPASLELLLRVWMKRGAEAHRCSSGYNRGKPWEDETPCQRGHYYAVGFNDRLSTARNGRRHQSLSTTAQREFLGEAKTFTRNVFSTGFLSKSMKNHFKSSEKQIDSSVTSGPINHVMCSTADAIMIKHFNGCNYKIQDPLLLLKKRYDEQRRAECVRDMRKAEQRYFLIAKSHTTCPSTS